MEITAFILSVISTLALVVALVAFLRRRRAHGAMEVREPLRRLRAAIKDGEVVFVRDHGLLAHEGQEAIRDLKVASSTVMDRKLVELLRRIETLYATAESEAAEPSHANPFVYAARLFAEHQPAAEIKLLIDEALARVSKLDRRRAGSY